MIRGINRQVVEVTETGCEYFERILFFVKPEYASLSASKLKEQASKITALSGAPPKPKKSKRLKFFISLSVGLGMVGFAVLATIILSL